MKTAKEYNQQWKEMVKPTLPKDTEIDEESEAWKLHENFIDKIRAETLRHAATIAYSDADKDKSGFAAHYEILNEADKLEKK